MAAPNLNQPETSYAHAMFIVIGGLVAIFMFVGMVSARHQSTAKLESDRVLTEQLPELGGFGDFSSSETCKTCHPEQHASWMQTFHRSMIMLPVAGNVMGNFDGQTIASGSLKCTVSQTNQTYWANMPDPDLLMQAVQGGKGET